MSSYVTLNEYKQYADITSTDTTDDAVLTQLIASASALIDRMTGRTFTLRNETHYFDVPRHHVLWLDDDLYAITSITNGDGTTVQSSDYIRWPYNGLPSYALEATGTSWVGSERITIVGSWGYSVSAPDDVKMAVLEIVRAATGRRSGQSQEGVARVTASGLVITPQGIPKAAAEIIMHYKRVVLCP